MPVSHLHRGHQGESTPGHRQRDSRPDIPEHAPPKITEPVPQSAGSRAHVGPIGRARWGDCSDPAFATARALAAARAKGASAFTEGAWALHEEVLAARRELLGHQRSSSAAVSNPAPMRTRPAICYSPCCLRNCTASCAVHEVGRSISSKPGCSPRSTATAARTGHSTTTSARLAKALRCTVASAACTQREVGHGIERRAGGWGPRSLVATPRMSLTLRAQASECRSASAPACASCPNNVLPRPQFRHLRGLGRTRQRLDAVRHGCDVPLVRHHPHGRSDSNLFLRLVMFSASWRLMILRKMGNRVASGHAGARRTSRRARPRTPETTPWL